MQFRMASPLTRPVKRGLQQLLGGFFPPPSPPALDGDLYAFHVADTVQ